MARGRLMMICLLAACGPSTTASPSGGDAGGGSGGDGEGMTSVATSGTSEGSTAGTGASGGPIEACPLESWRPDSSLNCCATLLQPCSTVGHACPDEPACQEEPSLLAEVLDSGDARCELASMASAEIAVHTRSARGRDGSLAIETLHVLGARQVVRTRFTDWSASGGEFFTGLGVELCTLADNAWFTDCLATDDPATLATCLDGAVRDCNADPAQSVVCPG